MKVDRRTTLKWLAAAMAASAGCSPERKSKPVEAGAAPRLPGGGGYGQDPDLMSPDVPWPLTMSSAQRRTAAALVDLILPADDGKPAASTLGVPEFVDEWVSAPYPEQRNDREVLLAGLDRFDARSRDETGKSFADAEKAAQAMLVDAIALPSAAVSADDSAFFRRFRFLAVAAYYMTDVGMAEVGYVGNVAISGDYPGPSDAALQHLDGVLDQLGLTLAD